MICGAGAVLLGLAAAALFASYPQQAAGAEHAEIPEMAGYFDSGGTYTVVGI